MKQIVVIGAGGFGREVYAIVADINEAAVAAGQPEEYEFLGFIDDGAPDADRLSRLNARHLGGMDSVGELPEGCGYVIGIGSGAVRRAIAQKCDAQGLTAQTLVAPSAYIGPDVRLSPGVVICANVSLTTNVDLREHAHVNLNSTVGHDAQLAAFSTVNPLVAISGGVIIGEETMVGTNSSINQAITVGEGSIIASGSAVTKDVPAHTLVAGVPASVKKALR